MSAYSCTCGHPRDHHVNGACMAGGSDWCPCDAFEERYDPSADATVSVASAPVGRDWIETFTGLRFRPLQPNPFLIRIADVAHALANTCRYRGHCRRFYSVAEHSVLVSYYVPAHLALEGLLHDAGEAYLGDIPRPLKRQPEMLPYTVAEARVESAIARRYGLRTDPATHEAIKTIDSRILGDEIGALMRWENHDDTRELVEKLGGPLGVRIECLLPDAAEQRFLDRFKEIGGRFVGR